MDGAGAFRDPQNLAAQLLGLLLGSDRVEEFLVEVARSAAGVVAGALACGVTAVATTGSRMWGASSDGLADRMDAVQYDIDDGPCLTCVRTGDVVAVDDIVADTRWPEFSRRGREEGAGASLSVPMVVGGRAVAALNLYARRAGALGTTDRDRAHQFADQAAGAVALAVRLGESEDSARNLTVALQSRTTIDHAIGVLIGQAGITAAEAFELLRVRSQRTNIKLRDVAAVIIAEAIRRDGDDPSLT